MPSFQCICDEVGCVAICHAPSLQQKKEQGAIDSADKEILAEAERLEVRAMGPLILSELLFDENIREQIKKYKRHFLRVSLSKSDMFTVRPISSCGR